MVARRVPVNVPPCDAVTDAGRARVRPFAGSQGSSTARDLRISLSAFKGKRIGAIMCSLGERYLSTPLFEGLTG